MPIVNDLTLSTLNAFGRTGATARRMGSRLDLLRSTGLRHGLHRLHGLGSSEVAPGARTSVYRRLWTQAAAAVGADEVEGLPGGILEIRRGQVRTRVWEHLAPLDDAVTLRLALDKRAVHKLLVCAGLPVPTYLEFSYEQWREAAAFLARAPEACVVKPAQGTGGGDLTTCDVRSANELMRARLRAGRGPGTLLIEHQTAGPVYRLLFLDGELLDVVRQVSPSIEGDGRSTIDDLIRTENRRRVAAFGDAGISPLRVDLDCIFTLAHAGLSLSSILDLGERRAVKTATNEGRLEDAQTARDELCEEIVDEARRAVAAVGVRVAGVDLITRDPSRPLRATGGIINEVNGTPGLHRHYQVADRENVLPVAVPILARLLEVAALPMNGRPGRPALRDPSAASHVQQEDAVLD
jgi:hypothetical protein